MDARRISRRYRALIVIIGVILTMSLVPIVPYSPYCWGRESGIDPIFLAPAYRKEFIDRLQLWDVPYIAVDGLVLVRLSDRVNDPDDWLINASNKAIRHLVEEENGASRNDVPEPVRRLIAQTRETFGFLELVCPLVRAVAIEGWGG